MALTGLNAYKHLFNNVQINSFDEICILASCLADAPVGFEHNLYLRQKRAKLAQTIDKYQKNDSPHYDIAIENKFDSDVITHTYTSHAAY